MFGFDTTDMRFRFSWHSDPEVQFEGAYVDNFKVVSIEDCEEKVFQTHTQGPICWPQIPDDHILYIDFPLDWEAVDLGICKKTCYDFKLWIEVHDGNYYTDYDWPNVVDIPICVGDFFDAGILDVVVETSFGQDIVIPGGSPDNYVGQCNQGEDLHVITWVHLQGTIPTYDVPVVFQAFKKEWKELYFTDFESGSMGWEFGHFGDFGSQWHVTDRDGYCGSAHSLGCFDKASGYYKNNIYVDYALNNKVYDVSKYLELECRYYTKFITEGPNDYWAFMISDPVPNFVLGNIGGVGFRTFGFMPEWMGPEQPICTYVDFDIMAAYNYWHDIRGFYRDASGADAYELSAGFAFWGSDATGFTHIKAETNVDECGESDPIYWSGLYFDDVGVYGLVAEELIYEEIIILPEMEPCKVYEVQFEWEDVPYSDYLLRISCDPEGACENWWWKIPWERQVQITSEKEQLHPKEVESIDMNDCDEGEWVCSDRDITHALATNTAVLYDGPTHAYAQLCPDHQGDCECDDATVFDEPCLMDITHLLGQPDQLLMDATVWWDLEGGLFDFFMYDMVVFEYFASIWPMDCPCEVMTDWEPFLVFGDWGLGNGLPDSSYWFTGFPSEDVSDGWITLSALGLLGALIQPDFTPMPLGPGGEIDLTPGAGVLPAGTTHFGLRFRFFCDGAWHYRGFKMDDIIITNLFYEGFPPEMTDYEDDFTKDEGEECDCDLSNWCTGSVDVGQYWFHKADRTHMTADIGTYCVFADEKDPVTQIKNGLQDPGEGFMPFQHDALIWTTEIMDCYAAYLWLETDYFTGVHLDGYHLYIEVDDGSGKWWKIDDLARVDEAAYVPGMTIASGGFIQPGCIPFDLSFLAGKEIQIRFRLLVPGDVPMPNDFFWCIRNVHITGKQDHLAPTSSITMTGTMKDSGWYSTAVKVKITAEDDASGVKEIHYILDGVHNVVAGDTAEFTVSGNGEHTLEYWSVDFVGNEEAHHIVPPFKIDSGAAPSVSITAPTPGIYIFGNQIMSFSKVFIIGAFTVEATASDPDSGIYKLSFYLDDELIGEDTEAPFSQYVATRHMGAGTIKVVAEDFAQNTAEDTLDVTYYKFL
jgi:hypothetical protein